MIDAGSEAVSQVAPDKMSTAADAAANGALSLGCARRHAARSDTSPLTIR